MPTKTVETRGDEEEVVEDERALAADRREEPALLHLRRADRKERERAADEKRQDGEDEDAARRVGGEGMHRCQHAGAHQERAEQRQREGEDGEEHGPHLERAALLHDDGGVKQRGPGQPRHEGSVLDRVPEPPAAPAELVIGPVGAHRDAGRQEHPGEQRPGPHPARPGGVRTPLKQRRDREGECDREADIAEIEKRRMDREPDVLEDRVQVLALERRRLEAGEGVRGQKDEEQEGGADPALHGEDAGAERARQVRPEAGDERAEEGEDQHPQKHRAFVVAPHAGDLEEQRLRGIAVLVDVLDREVGGHVRRDERAEGDRHEAEADDRRRSRHCDEALVAPADAKQRHARLDEHQRQREHQRVVAELGDGKHAGRAAHCTLPFVSCQTPCAFKASTTSFGM